jgi:hypothetical protein
MTSFLNPRETRDMKLRTLTSALLLLLLTPALLATAQDPATTVRAIDLGGLQLKAPVSWKEAKAASTMRKLQLVIPKAEGADDGELAVFVFPTGAGTIQANVDRWAAQFKDASGQPPKPESKVVKGHNVDVTRVKLAGTFTDPFAGKGAQPDYKLLGAIVETPAGAYFLKLIGPAKTVDAAEPAFDKLIASMKTGS